MMGDGNFESNCGASSREQADGKVNQYIIYLFILFLLFFFFSCFLVIFMADVLKLI